MPSGSEFQAYLSLTPMSSLSAHSHWSCLQQFLEQFLQQCCQDLSATELTTAYSRVHQAHTWFSFHGTFIVKSLLADEFNSLFLLSFIYLPEKKLPLMKFNCLCTFYLYRIQLNQSLLKFITIFFMWGPRNVSERTLSYLLLAPHTSNTLFFLLTLS